jgi:hypothetical protein
MRHILLAVVVSASTLVFAQQQPCPTGYHHEGDSAACWPDVSTQHQQEEQDPQPKAEPQPKPRLQTQQSADSELQSKSKITVYRRSAYFAHLRKVPIYVDGAKIADLTNSAYYIFEVSAGKHAFRSKTGKDEITVTTEPGKDYFFRTSLSQGFMKNSWDLIEVDSNQAKTDLQGLHVLDMKNTKKN